MESFKSRTIRQAEKTERYRSVRSGVVASIVANYQENVVTPAPPPRCCKTKKERLPLGSGANRWSDTGKAIEESNYLSEL